MKIKPVIAALVTVSASLVLSSNALAGELYGGVSATNSKTEPSISSVVQLPVNTFGEGEIYIAANDALDFAKGSPAPRQAFVTTLAVGGELGYPTGGSSNYRSTTDTSAFAE